MQHQSGQTHMGNSSIAKEFLIMITKFIFPAIGFIIPDQNKAINVLGMLPAPFFRDI